MFSVFFKSYVYSIHKFISAFAGIKAIYFQKVYYKNIELQFLFLYDWKRIGFFTWFWTWLNKEIYLQNHFLQVAKYVIPLFHYCEVDTD